MTGNSKHPAASNANSISRISIFGPAPILPNEDSAAYDELLARVSAEVKPTDIIEEIWIRDVVDLTWEILRWRRIRTSLVAAEMSAKLRPILARLIPAGSWQSVGQKLIKGWDEGKPAAIKRVNKLLSSANIAI